MLDAVAFVSSVPSAPTWGWLTLFGNLLLAPLLLVLLVHLFARRPDDGRAKRGVRRTLLPTEAKALQRLLPSAILILVLFFGGITTASYGYVLSFLL